MTEPDLTFTFDPEPAEDLTFTYETRGLQGDPALMRVALIFTEDVDFFGGDFTEVAIYGLGGYALPRELLASVGATVLNAELGANFGLWTITASGPCTPVSPALRNGEIITNYGGQVAVGWTTTDTPFAEFVNIAAERNHLVAVNNDLQGTKTTLEDDVPHHASGAEVGGKWALVCSPGHYEVPDFGPFDTDGMTARYRVVALAPDPNRVTGNLISFLEMLTQVRQTPGAWGQDQDNYEDALVVDRGRVGAFSEHCKIDTPAPVEGGEYGAGRLHVIAGNNEYTDPLFKLVLGEPIELLRRYEFNVDGQWVQAWYRRTSYQSYDLETGGPVGAEGDTTYWKRVARLVGTDGPGSIADAGMPWAIGLNLGLLGVERIEVHKGIAAPELVMHFDTADVQPDGTVASSGVPGQVFTPVSSPVVIDTTPLGLAAMSASITTQRWAQNASTADGSAGRTILPTDGVIFQGSGVTQDFVLPSIADVVDGFTVTVFGDNFTLTAPDGVGIYDWDLDTGLLEPINTPYTVPGTCSITYDAVEGRWNVQGAMRRYAQVDDVATAAQGATADSAVQPAAAMTLTNKRITRRVATIVSSATPTVNTDNYDAVSITALAAAITSMTTNLSGTPTDFQPLLYRIKDDGTARAITWGASFAARGATPPTTTTLGKVTTVGFMWNSVASTWDCVAATTEA